MLDTEECLIASYRRSDQLQRKTDDLTSIASDAVQTAGGHQTPMGIVSKYTSQDSG